jgi:predicted esterase
MNGQAQMRNYTQRCPNSHLIVMGFSQGGSVQLDVLGGGGGELWGCMQESNPAMNITSAPGSKGTHTSIHQHHQVLDADMYQSLQQSSSVPLVVAQTKASPTAAARYQMAAHHEQQNKMQA